MDSGNEETTILTGPATNWHSKQTGVLTLTNRRLVFVPREGPARFEISPHRLGVREEPHFEAPLDHVVSTRLVPPLIGSVVTLEVIARQQKAVFEVENVHDWLREIRTAQSGPPPVFAAAPNSPAPPPAAPNLPPCPRCGGTPVRDPSGMLRCPNCSPAP